jgi:hypothetical protein
MSQKANLAVSAGNVATLQFGMRLDAGVQRPQILLNQRLGAIVLMPIRPKGEELPDRDNKKAKFSATIPMFLRTPSSYLTEAHASRGRARFFCATKYAAADNRSQRHHPYGPLQRISSPTPTPLRYPNSPNGYLEKKNPFFFPSSGHFT